MLPQRPMPAAEMLAAGELFEGLSGEAVSEVLRAGRVRRLIEGTSLFGQGNLAQHCHVLIHGRIKIVQTGADGQQLLVRFVGPGETFGTVALFGDHRYPAEAVAVSDCVVMNWSEAVLRDLIVQFPCIALNLLAIIGHRLHEAQSRLREVSTERVERRVAHALLRLARQAGRPAEGGTAIDLPLTRQDIAELTGSTLCTVSRILAGWQQQGIMRGGRKRVVITRPDAVTRIAAEAAIDGRENAVSVSWKTRQRVAYTDGSQDGARL